MLKIKRVYEEKEETDGKRVLVDRLWPRGLTSQQAGVDEWLRDIAPSDELRTWFNHEPEKWDEFKRRYEEELAAPVKHRLLEQLAREAARGSLTLVYGAKETRYNNARVLEEVVTDLMMEKSHVS